MTKVFSVCFIVCLCVNLSLSQFGFQRRPEPRRYSPYYGNPQNFVNYLQSINSDRISSIITIDLESPSNTYEFRPYNQRPVNYGQQNRPVNFGQSNESPNYGQNDKDRVKPGFEDKPYNNGHFNVPNRPPILPEFSFQPSVDVTGNYFSNNNGGNQISNSAGDQNIPNADNQEIPSDPNFSNVPFSKEPVIETSSQNNQNVEFTVNVPEVKPQNVAFPVNFPDVKPSFSTDNLQPLKPINVQDEKPQSIGFAANLPDVKPIYTGFTTYSPEVKPTFSTNNLQPLKPINVPDEKPQNIGFAGNLADVKPIYTGFTTYSPEVKPTFSTNNLQPLKPVNVPDVKPIYTGFTTNAPDFKPTFSTENLQPLTPIALEPRENFNFENFHDSCQTPDGGLGSCTPIFSCPQYATLLTEARTNTAAVQLLRKAHCGFVGNKPKVCCPSSQIPSAPPPLDTTTGFTTTTTAAPSSDGFLVPPECGASNASFSRVVGGVDAKLGHFPFMALLGYRGRSDSGPRWLCGGSLVSRRHVLTAAHCIHNHEKDLYLVRLGELDLAKEDEGATPIDVPIARQLKHENYSPKSVTNDIGLLTLETDVEFTDLIRPVCIPKEREMRSQTFEKYRPFLAGWGDTEFRGPSATHLQVTQLPVVTQQQCKQAYAQYKAQVIDERVLCAGYPQGGRDACQGDSGGPLMQPIYNDAARRYVFYQIGVVSYGKKCAEAGFPGVYTRVTHFVPWLQKHMSENP